MEKPKLIEKNMYGIDIVKCCASCKYKKSDIQRRLCMKGEGSVPSDYLCRSWEMSDGLKNAGKGGGTVKKKEYLSFAIDSLVVGKSYKETYGKPRITAFKTLDDIRNEYRESHGDIYEEGL